MVDAVVKPVEKRAFSLGLTRSDVLIGLLLAVVMLAGGYFRFVGQNWDDYTHFHPDERFLTGLVSQIGGQLSFNGEDLDGQLRNCMARYPDNAGRGGYFDAQCSPWNPNNVSGGGFMAYGTLPVFIVRWSADLAIQIYKDPNLGGYYGAHLVGRFVSAVADMLTILVVFFIGVRLYGKWTGLLAAILYACTVFAIQQSHFWTVDAIANLFVTLAIWCAVRVQDSGGLGAYFEFGIFFGASIASRINTAPVFGLLLLAIGVRMLPLFDRRLAWGERQRILTSIMTGLILALLSTFLIFRIANPYAFTGPGFFGLLPNPRWLANLAEAQRQVSGNAEFAPNWQWAGRTPYLFPFGNMVLWGMGIGLGIAGWLAWLWSGWRLIRGRAGALQNILLFVWILVYFGWLGRNWVSTMRYFMPMYPVMALLAAWGLSEIVKRAVRGRRIWRQAVAWGLLVGATGFTILWAVMFTNIYRHLFTPVQSSNWVWENLPGDFSMQVEGANAPLINIAVVNSQQQELGYQVGKPTSAVFTAPESGVIKSLHADHLGDTQDSAENKQLRITISDATTKALLSDAILTSVFSRQNAPLGGAYDVTLNTPVTVTKDQQYIITVDLANGGPLISDGNFSAKVDTLNAPLVNIPVINRLGGNDIPLELQASRYETGQTYVSSFVATADGVINSVHSMHLGDPNDDPEPETIRVQINQPNTDVAVAEGLLTADLVRDQSPMGDAYDIPLSEPLSVEKGQTYTFSVTVLSGGPVISSGPVFAWEGEWDEVSLPKVCALPNSLTLADDPPPGLVSVTDCQGRDLWSTQLHSQWLQIFYEDEVGKRDLMQKSLDNSDYLVISTNRRYDSQSRIPYRWPMTMRFYDGLFSGKLGFELVKTFQETFELGPLKISDQYLPTYNAPKWLNEFEAEEAFHVYDHPAVFIFRKTPTYSSSNTASILGSVPLTKVETALQLGNCPFLVPGSTAGIYCDPTLVGLVPLYSVPASSVPTLLQFPPDLARTQYDNGTWSVRFHSESIINTNAAVTLAGWWLTIVIFGWVVWPTLFAILPGLADRGYALSKAVGLLVVAWLTWFISSARIPVWSQTGVLGALVFFGLLSVFLGWRRRLELATYLREHGRKLIWIEAITLLAFIAFLIVRLSNPDLWHTAFGGEKPMDFAYFNGVLRSTVFPPIDPWHAGGYINYYYFGYVIVGAPVLLLGLMPSIAYNLIIPTLFSLTGMGAFSVAFNVVSAWRERQPEPETEKTPIAPLEVPLVIDEPIVTDDGMLYQPRIVVEAEPVVEVKTIATHRMRLANPWIAGLAALVLAVVVGNLDTPRVFISEGLLKTGYYQQPLFLQNQLVQEYTARNGGVAPTGDALNEITEQANNQAYSPILSILNGLKRVGSGQPLDLAPNRWYWAPTRIIGEAPDGGGGAIAEFPFFTFLYGDLHAHMIAMPMQFLAMAFVLNELLLAGRDKRNRWSLFLAISLGALTVGLLRATNTWDWITYILLGVLGLGFAWWLGTQKITRRSLVTLVVRVGGFLALSFLYSLPYITWYAAVYNRALPWTGPKTQLWMYFTMFGLFLFIILSVLVWDTGRWLRSVYVGSLRGKWAILLGLILVIIGVLLGALIMSANYPVTIVALPLLLWVAILFLRDGQTREMQFVLALAGLALGLTLGVEYVVLDGDIGRQNTVFKFYIQAWLLMSAAGGVGVAWLIGSSRWWSTVPRYAWYGIGGVLLMMAAIYPFTASRGRSMDRMTPDAPKTMSDVPLTLDGMDYMKYASLYEGDPMLISANAALAPFPLSDDYNMIRWMQENIQGTPTIIEGQSDRILYRWGARVAILTGLPSVIGWDWHQKQQRTFDPLPRLVQQRVSNVSAFYTTPDVNTAWGILRNYDVGYIVVSSLERAYYPKAGLDKFDTMVAEGKLEVAYQQGVSTVYKVNKDPLFNLVEDVPGGI